MADAESSGTQGGTYELLRTIDWKQGLIIAMGIQF